MSEPADVTRLSGRIHERIATLVGRPLNWLFFAMIIGSYPLIHVATHPLPDPIPIFDRVDAFELVDHRGEKIGLWRENSPREQAISTCAKVAAVVPKDMRSPDLICEHPNRPEGIDELCSDCLAARDRGRLHVNLDGMMWVASLVCADCEAMDEELTKALYKIQHHSRAMGKHFKIVGLSSQPEKDTPEALSTFAGTIKASRGMRSFITGDPEKVARVVDGIFNRKTATARGKSASLVDHSVLAIIDPGGYIRGYYDLRDPKAMDQCLTDIGLVVNRGF